MQCNSLFIKAKNRKSTEPCVLHIAQIKHSENQLHSNDYKVTVMHDEILLIINLNFENRKFFAEPCRAGCSSYQMNTILHQWLKRYGISSVSYYQTVYNVWQHKDACRRMRTFNKRVVAFGQIKLDRFSTLRTYFECETVIKCSALPINLPFRWANNTIQCNR